MLKHNITLFIVHRYNVVFIFIFRRDGTALGGSELGIGADYIVTKDTLTFADGEITKAITIEVNSEIKVSFFCFFYCYLLHVYIMYHVSASNIKKIKNI